MTPAKPTADPNADRQQLRRELLKLIVKNESARRGEPKESQK